MPLDFEAVGREVQALLTVPLDVNAGIARLIDLCEGAHPHPDWARLRAIDYAADVPRLRAWFDRALETEPPATPVRGLFFDVCQPVTDEGLATADMALVGTSDYDPADAGLEWLFTGHYRPGAYAEASALDRLYEIAYGTRDPFDPRPGVLGNDAEYPIGLAFAVLAARAILAGRSLEAVPTDAPWVGIAAGFGEGDILLVGELTAQGFRPPPPR